MIVDTPTVPVLLGEESALYKGQLQPPDALKPQAPGSIKTEEVCSDLNSEP